MIGTMHGSLVAAIPMTEGQFGLVLSSYAWVFGLASTLAGYASDRLSRRWVIITAMLVWSGVTALTAYATTFPQLLAMRMLLALSEAFYIPAAGALIADYHRGSTRSLAAGIHLTGFFVGGMLAGVGGWLAERHNSSYAFGAIGLPGVAYCLLLLLGLREAPREGGGSSADGASAGGIRLGAALGSLFSRGSFFIVLGCVTLADVVGFLIIGWLPTYMGEHFRLGQSMAGFSATGFVFGMSAVGLLLGGFLTTRWGTTNPRSCVLIPVIGLCIAAGAMLLATNTRILPLAIGGLALFGLTASWFTVNVLPLLCLVTDPRYRATGYGLVNAFGCFIGGVLVYAAGILRDVHVDLHHIFTFAAVFLLLCAVLLLLIKSPTFRPAVGLNSPSVE